jgi:TolB protein
MNPKWSPDGSRIAFFSTRDGNEEIYVVDLESGRLDRLTTHPAADRNPAWSPDGRLLAFDSERTGRSTLWLTSVDGTVDGGALPRRVTAAEGQHEKIPAWSPDGRWLAFSARERGPWRVAAVRLDGTESRVVASAAGDCRPDFSPDGASVTFVSTRADGKGDLWTVPFDGGEPRRLTTTDALYDYHPSWSPDGRHLAFAAGPDKERYKLFVIAADGTGRRQITSGPSHDAHPSWAR